MEKRERSAGDYFVQRRVLDEVGLDEVAQKGTWAPKPRLAERLKESLRCSAPRLKQAALSWIPVLGWLPRYSLRENAIGDLVSGCSVGIMHLPQGMAYALLASLRPVFGLYTSLYPVLVYFIFGTSRHISIGTFAVISIMIGSVTERLAPDSAFMVNGTNETGSVDLEARDAFRVEVACSLTLLTGLFQILLGVVRFGFVVTYLSEPLIRGYTTASACHVCVSQLKYLFGVTPARFTGPLALLYTLVDICRLLPQTRVPELVVSLVALSVLIVVKEINGCYRQKLPLPIPIELIVIIAATAITHFCGLTSKYSVDVVGEIPSGLKAPRAPDASLFSQVIGDAFAVAIVGYAINISLGKTFALKHGYKVDSNQELVALGLSNTVGGFFQCYSVTSSLSRSLVQESTGGKTQVAGLISSIIVLVTVLKIGSLFSDLPKAVLSTIVFVNLKGMFRQLSDVPLLWRTNQVDLLVWLVTFFSTILLNLDLGLAVSIGFSMLTVIFRMQLPRYSILGHIPGTDLYLDTETYKESALKPWKPASWKAESGIDPQSQVSVKHTREEDKSLSLPTGSRMHSERTLEGNMPGSAVRNPRALQPVSPVSLRGLSSSLVKELRESQQKAICGAKAAEARLEVGPLAQLEQEEHRLPTWELVRRLEGVIRPPRGNWKHFSNVWGTDRSSCHA
ncbi:solute carrier family 26 member 6-like [Pseudoliparis swirei]|uniref:solute carrier family 26 member 6-like n=1 Tax=Pseudoliparis swirei TaxID=2059687 RepID=UPI0024BEEA3C|nr:solute carrier family 26 member 6-like [Pseudoliparis swirei]